MFNVSFVIPAYNEALIIGATIDAIIAAVGRDVHAEIIVVDNASTDDTYNVAACHPVRVIQEPRKGITNARQAGYMAAKYPWIACIDADTIIPPGWLDRARSGVGDPRVVAVTGPLRYLGLSPLVLAGIDLFYVGARVLHHTVGATIQGGNCLIKRSALDMVGGFDTSIEFYGEDTRTASLLSTVGKVKNDPKLWAYSSSRRLQEQGIMNTAWTYAVNYMAVSLKGKPATREYEDYRGK